MVGFFLGFPYICDLISGDAHYSVVGFGTKDSVGT